MLNERTLSAMDRDQLVRYISVLHQALGHVLGAASEAQAYVKRTGGEAQRSPSRNPMDPMMEQLARALAGGPR